jgi:hypothetical protein
MRIKLFVRRNVIKFYLVVIYAKELVENALRVLFIKNVNQIVEETYLVVIFALRNVLLNAYVKKNVLILVSMVIVI